jgi:two-component system, NtrC family, sensor kinase
MTPPPQAPPSSGAPSQPPFRELSRTFWRGINSTHSLGPALDSVLHEFNTHIGTRRSSVWLHDRRARELRVFASSDPHYGAGTARVAITDPSVPAARGLRMDRAQILADGTEAVLISPLRGWRRALGTLVVEGTPALTFDDQQQLDLANELGRQLSAGIENVQLLEDMLRQRRVLEDTFHSLLDPVVVAGRDQQVVQMNDAFAVRLGKSRQELVERSLADLVGPELAEWALGADDTEVSGERVRTFDHPALGGIFSVTATPLINEDGEPVGTVIVARDITRQTRLETEREALRTRLAQTEKLASLGQFVAGIAHEINNPLQSVLGHLELIIGSPGTPGTAELTRTLRKDLRRVFHEADRAAKIVRNLLTFTGSQRKARQSVRIDRVITRALAGRRTPMTRAGIEIIREQGDDLPQLSGDPLLLQQALLNVLINAEHAIVETGAPGSITVTTAASPRGVAVTIRDTGRGIPPDILPRIFDPFFTTKDVGQGTGLGLAITYGIIQEHGGTITAANDPAGGAVFTIELPAVDGNAKV